MRKILAILGICATLSACSTQRFVLNGHPTIPTKEGTAHFVFWGIGQEKLIAPEEVCGKNVAAVETFYSFWNGVASALTFGIYSPNSYAIYCKRNNQLD